MKKGYSLTEMLVVLAILAVIALPLSRLSKTVIYDIPRSLKLYESNTSILNFVQFVRRDINSADKLLKDGNQLLLERGDKKIKYVFEEDEITRNISGKDEIKWEIPQGKIEWKVWEEKGKGIAVEIRKWVEPKKHGRADKRIENSYVFFAGEIE
ncbi:MAG: hypothetical protein BWY69_01100 [Planctomycetes bacterium ADurb.Bin401]|nr:MAG: hypothetical protein BWY69_01100 [Planctomycetes bacterium ADurb.Bin401]